MLSSCQSLFQPIISLKLLVFTSKVHFLVFSPTGWAAPALLMVGTVPWLGVWFRGSVHPFSLHIFSKYVVFLSLRSIYFRLERWKAPSVQTFGWLQREIYFRKQKSYSITVFSFINTLMPPIKWLYYGKSLFFSYIYKYLCKVYRERHSSVTCWQGFFVFFTLFVTSATLGFHVRNSQRLTTI